MASSTRLGPFGLFFWGVLGCFLVLIQSSAANKLLSPPTSTFKTVTISELAPPVSGTLGLSPLIQPIKQTNSLNIYFSDSAHNPLRNNTSYINLAYIQFRCIQPTKRIAVNANPEWKLNSVQVKNGSSYLTVKEYFFAEETLYIDLVDSMKINVTYELIIHQEPSIVEGDTFGLQAYKRIRDDTGDVIFTMSLSGAPKAMRHFVPCFDDPAYAIPYQWRIYVYYGLHNVPIVMMNAPRGGVSHSCSDSTPGSRRGYYYFDFPPMAIEATELRIVPFSWYAGNDSPTPPPPQCY